MKKYIFISLLFISCLNTFGQNFPIPITYCPDDTFSSNTLGWSLFYANNNYNQNNFLSALPSGVTYLQGSNTLSSVPEGTSGNRISIADIPELYDNTLYDFGAWPINLIKFIRIGGALNVGKGSEQILKKYNLTLDDSRLYFFYSVVFSPGGTNEDNIDLLPFFKYQIKVQYSDGTFAALPSNFSDLITPADQETNTNNNNRIHSSQTIYDFSPYVDFCKNPVVTISCMVSDCKFVSAPQPDGYSNVNSAYAYITANCIPNDWHPIQADGKLCVNTVYDLLAPPFNNESGSPISYGQWTIKNLATGDVVNLPNGIANYAFPSAANYLLTYNIHFANGCVNSFNYYFEVFICPPSTECVDCTSFDLEIGKKYVVTGWVNVMKDPGDGTYYKINVYDYDKAKIAITFLDVGGSEIGSGPQILDTSGEIIDGWQRIYGEILIPSDIDDLKIELVNNYTDEYSTFFDDIRIHPVDGNMKSFVYDQKTQKLMAELDENNYATFYEYDKEGGLVRVKKETEKGVFTIQETRSSTTKIHN